MGKQLIVAGTDSITISRGPGGVPHAVVTNEPDLYRALGYCHARDRGMQMLLVRILASGRAAELLDGSDATVEVDRFFRRMNFGRDADRAAEGLDEQHRVLAEAYGDGVNQGFEQSLPWELRLLGVSHHPWEWNDSLVLARLVGYISLAQSQGDMERLLVEMVQAGVPMGKLEEMFPGHLDELDVELVRKVKLHRRVVPDGIRWACAVPRVMASNNWVVAGSRTRSGFPILCNDPHLEVNRLPAVWYEFTAQVGEEWAIAATMPGLPGLLIGRNRHLAWGATYAFMDAEDSWIEDCKDGCFRRGSEEDDSWVPFDVRKETILRKNGTPVEVVFYENEHGVLDGDPNQPGLYLATRWSGCDTGSRSIAASFDMWSARTVEEGAGHLGNLETAFNWVLGDREGHIGYQMSGLCPRRRPGASGLVPLPGWDPANDWLGFVSPEELPRELDPDRGYIATANDDLNHLGVADPINLSMGQYRVDRISKLLAGRDDWDIEAMRKLQLDLHSPQAGLFMEILRPLLPATDQGRVLGEWDLRYDLDSEGAYLFEAFYAALLQDVFGPVWGRDVHQHFASDTAVFVDLFCNFDRILLSAESAWFDGRSREEVFSGAAARALDCPIEPWRVERLLLLRHILFGGKLPGFLGFDYGPIPLPGGRATVQQGQFYRSAGRETSFAPSYRFITDMSDDAAHTSLAGGPSDRRFSALYTADLAMWAQGETKTLRGVWQKGWGMSVE